MKRGGAWPFIPEPPESINAQGVSEKRLYFFSAKTTIRSDINVNEFLVGKSLFSPVLVVNGADK